MFDAEPLFLVDDDKAEVAELDVVREQAVGADNDIDGAVTQTAQRLLLFARAAVAREQADADREGLHAGHRGVEVLPGQDRRRGQDRTLLAAHHAFEGRAQRNFSLADADVAADKPIHRPGLFHILLDLGRGGQLVGGFVVGKALLKIALPGIVGREGVAVGLLAAGIELNELLGHRLGRSAHPLAGFRPLAAAQPAQLDLVRIAGSRIAGEQVELGDRDVEHVLFVVFDAQVVLGDALHLHALDAGIPADAVVLVDDEVAGGDVGQAVQRVLHPLGLALLGRTLPECAGREHRVVRKRQLAPGRKMPGQHLHLAFGRRGRRVGGNGEALGAQVLCQAGRRTLGAGEHRNAKAAAGHGAQVIDKRGNLAAPGRQAVGRRVDQLFERLVGQAAGKVFGQYRAAAPGLGVQPAGFGVELVQPGAERAVLKQAAQFFVPAVGGRAVSLPDRGRFLD